MALGRAGRRDHRSLAAFCLGSRRRELDDEVPDDPHAGDADEIARHEDPQVARVDCVGRREVDEVRELLRVEVDDRADAEARADGRRRAADVDPNGRAPARRARKRGAPSKSGLIRAMNSPSGSPSSVNCRGTS